MNATSYRKVVKAIAARNVRLCDDGEHDFGEYRLYLVLDQAYGKSNDIECVIVQRP